MILALAYVVMALGLNIVVGFAGLLDLGYVAFYAFGAYTIGWFASDHFAYINNEEGIHVFAGEFVSNTPGIHLNFLLILVVAAALCALVGAIIGLPTLRLRGDYIAIVTLAFGEIIYRFAVNGDEINFAENYSLTNGRQAISPIDQIDLPFFAEFDSRVQPAAVLLVRAGARRPRAVLQLPPARLAPRPRVDRHPRGRGRGRLAWACRSSRPSCWPTRRARPSAAWPARSSAPTSPR